MQWWMICFIVYSYSGQCAQHHIHQRSRDVYALLRWQQSSWHHISSDDPSISLRQQLCTSITCHFHSIFIFTTSIAAATNISHQNIPTTNTSFRMVASLCLKRTRPKIKWLSSDQQMLCLIRHINLENDVSSSNEKEAETVLSGSWAIWSINNFGNGIATRIRELEEADIENTK